MKNYKDLVIELCEYYGMDHLYPYENLDIIEMAFKNRLDDSEADRIVMLGKMNRLNEINRELVTKKKSSSEYEVYEFDENGSHILCYCEEGNMADVICRALALADPKGDSYFYSPVPVAGTFVPGGGGYTGYRKLPDGKLDKLTLG